MRHNQVPVIRFIEPFSADTDHGGEIILQGYAKGKCVYSKNDVLRQPFEMAEYNPYQGFLMFPDIDKSLNLPRGGTLLQDVAQLFNQYGVRHNINDVLMQSMMGMRQGFELVGRQQNQFQNKNLSRNGGRQPPQQGSFSMISAPPPSPPPQPPSELPMVMSLPDLSPADGLIVDDEEFLVPEEYELMSRIPHIPRPVDLMW